LCQSANISENLKKVAAPCVYFREFVSKSDILTLPKKITQVVKLSFAILTKFKEFAAIKLTQK